MFQKRFHTHGDHADMDPVSLHLGHCLVIAPLPSN